MNKEETIVPDAQDEDKDIQDPSELEDEDAPRKIRYEISSYGADYTVDVLVKRLKAKDICIPPFQRGYVWTLSQASRFIESLLLGLPVPGIFLFKNPDTQKLYVIDGQQRLKTIQFFSEGVLRDKAFKLVGVTEELLGRTYGTLVDSDRRRLDDAIIHATIVRQEKPKDDDSSIYSVFDRLNTGGSILSPQELRCCIYDGSFCRLLKELNDNHSWRDLYGAKNSRLRDQEVILRFFALVYDHANYSRPMKDFLSQFMARNRNLQTYSDSVLRSTFVTTVEYAVKNLGRKIFRPEGPLNVAVTDALLVATALRLQSGPLSDSRSYKSNFERLLNDKGFSAQWKSNTTDDLNVKNRIALALDAIRDIK